MKVRPPAKLFLIAALVALMVVVAFAQRSWRGPMVAPPGGVAGWSNDPEFEKDVFTFVRIRYTSINDRGWRGRWAIDAPDAELNFSYRLQQLTSIKVNPNPLVLELTDPELFNYPFIYIVEPGWLVFRDEEVVALRKYLLNGGFLMVDDFWGQREYDNFYREIKRVFPDREPVELPIEHSVFNIVFPLEVKPQVPAWSWWRRHQGMPWESYERPDAEGANYQGIFDDKGRMMVIICHNTDLADGWEREGEHEEYFRKYAEPLAYPMGINIVFYALTH
jgi:hypothetical protein